MDQRISIIIPVFQEYTDINRAIAWIRGLKVHGDVEIVIADGDLKGSTIQTISDSSVKKVISEKGRGIQLNTGADVATGDVLIFLHADTALPATALEQVHTLIRGEGEYVGGAFDLRIDSNRLVYRLIEKAASWRSRLTRIPYGDQAIFISASYFRHIGGFRNIPIMEDVDLMKRIKNDGRKIILLNDQAITSARRWETEGAFQCTLRNWILITLFSFGVSPEKLAHFYR
ncbi:MAG: TIGR04283 family arsenosugar biosynthesis glycosyltransferase [Syntrophales bacterium]